MSHLLSLSELHAAAPGVLDVVFGADGEFLLAPMFRPPLWHADGHWVWQYQVDDLAVQPLALDLRTTAFDRLAKLCARVCLKHIGVTDVPLSVYVYDDWERCGLEVHTSGTDRYRQRLFCWDGADGGGNDHFLPSGKRDLFDLPVYVVARPQPDPISFLAALTLFLAPRIRDLTRRES